MRQLIGVTVALPVLASLLLSPPAEAAGPDLPVDIISPFGLSTDALGGNLVLPDGTTKISTYVTYRYCGGPNGRCGDRPTLQEVTVGRVQGICGGPGSCRGYWVPGTSPRTYQVEFRDFIVTESPTLASLGLANLPPESWIGVSVRLRNSAGWSQPYDQSVQVAAALDPADTLPTNISPPELGSGGGQLNRELLIDWWISAWDVGRWAPGAVTKPQAVRIQAARCPNDACQVTPAQYEAAAITKVCRYPRNDLATQSLNCNFATTITDAPSDACWRMRSQALNRKGWSAWAESPKKCVGSANAGGGNGAANNGANLDLDLGAIAPLRPGVVDLAQPAPTRLPTFNADRNPVSPIPARGNLTAGTSYGAVGTGWRLPNGWQSPNLLASTTFTLLGCTGKEPATCTPAGTWPATSLVGQNPALASTGAIALTSPYARIAQSTIMTNATGARVTKIGLGDWVAVVPAAQPPASSPPAEAPPADGGGNSGGSGSGDGASDPGQESDSPSAVDIPPVLLAVGVDGRITPLVGTNGEGSYQGLTLKVKVPTVQRRGVRVKATATVTPSTKGKVWFTFTRTGPNGKVAVGKTRKVSIRGTKAKASWTFEQAKPTGTYLLIVRFVPSKKGTTGAMVTKPILVK